MSRASRVRTFLIVFVVVAVVVVALTLVVRGIVLSGFETVEHDSAISNLERVDAALRGDVAALPKVAKDWGNWDDTYEFMGGEYPEYVDENLQSYAVANLGLSHMLYFDSQRRLVHGTAVDLETQEGVELDPALVEAITGSEPLFDLPEPASVSFGIVDTPDGLVLAGAAAITDSDFAMPPRGTLVVVTPLDATAVESLAEKTRLDLDLVDREEASGLQLSHEPLGPGPTSAGMAVLAVDDETMLGVVPVRDTSGTLAGSFVVSMRRDMWSQGLAVTRWLSVAVWGFGVLLLAVLLGIYDRRVLTTSRSVLEHAVAERTRELVTSEARFRDLVDHMAQGLLAVDESGTITFANREAERLFDASAGSLAGRRAGSLFVEDDVERHLGGDEARIASVDATIDRYGAPVPVQIVATGSGEGLSGQWLVRDVTMQRRYEQQLVHLASHDHLTGLANRRRFEQELERELSRSDRTGHGGGVLWLDLDNFKEVNDSLGHRSGDELLVSVAGFLLASTRASGIVARIGGDEFAVLLPEASTSEVEATARRLIEDMSSQRFEVSGHRLAVTASVGAVAYPDHGTSVEELLSRADIAMYAAKERGSGGHSVWTDDRQGDESNRTRLEWSERIRHAVDNDAVVVFAQPIARSETGDVASHELLMRLPGDEPGHLLMPGDFLPAAERLGLIRDLDRWMVLRAINLVAERPELGLVHVNLSGRAFADTGLLDVIEDEFERTGADPAKIGFEITETAAIADLQCARELIGGLRRLGCGLSLDDFGSGFSSFYYLRNLPIDCLKIDGSFVRQLKTSEADRHLVRAMVELARALGLDTVAEYVEDEETLAIVREMGVTFAQGYHVGRPAPLDSIVMRGPS